MAKSGETTQLRGCCSHLGLGFCFLCGVIAAGSIIFSANAVTFHKLSPATTMKTQTVTKTTHSNL